MSGQADRHECGPAAILDDALPGPWPSKAATTVLMILTKDNNVNNNDSSINNCNNDDNSAIQIGIIAIKLWLRHDRIFLYVLLSLLFLVHNMCSALHLALWLER